MFRYLLPFIGFTLLLPAAVSGQSDDDIPPLLAYASMNTVEQEYHVLDFASGDITTIETASYPYPEFGGEEFMPQEVILQSPYDETVQMVFTSADFMPEEEQYILYRLDANGERTQIAEHAIPLFRLQWSPNARYFYFMIYDSTTDASSGNYHLYQYDLISSGMPIPILERMGDSSCHIQVVWCLVRRWKQPDQYTQMELYLINANTGELTFLADTNSRSEWAWWQPQTPTFIYSVEIGGNRYALRLYNYDDHTDTLITEVDGAYISQVMWSLDQRWLAITNDSDLYVLDTQAENAAPILLTGDIDASVSTRYLRWMAVDTLFYDASASSEGEEPGYGYYVTTVPDGYTTTVEVNLNAALVDDDWSPDGRWLALSFTNYGDENAAYIVDALGEVPVRQLEVDFDPGDMICVDWYDADVYATDITGLCDIYTGIG